MGSERKSQLFSFDFAASAVVFLAFFLIFFLSYTRLNEETRHSENLREMISTATALSSVLCTSGGFPAGWTNETVLTIGLAEEENVISLSRLQQFGNVSYSASKQFLPAGAFEYFLNLTSLTGEEIFSYGIYPYDNSTSIVPIERMLLYNNGTGRRLSKMEVLVWE
ncbi:MAG: hypothetical protein V1820_04315 [archaeon]